MVPVPVPVGRLSLFPRARAGVTEGVPPRFGLAVGDSWGLVDSFDSGLVCSMSSGVSSVWVVALRLDCPCRHPRPDSGGPGGSVQFRTFVGCGGDDIVGLRDSTLRQLSPFNALHNRIAPEGINASWPLCNLVLACQANQAGGPPEPDSRLAMAPQNAKCFGISAVPPAWTSVCVLYPPAIPTTSLPPLETPSATPATPGLASWLFGGLAASLLRWLLGCLSHTPVELHMPREVPPPWAWEWESWNAAKGDPGREAWKARSSADESGFQCISAGTSPPGLSTPGWKGTATGGQFKRSIAQGADSPCRICPQGSTCVPAPVSRPVGVPPLPCPFPSPMS